MVLGLASAITGGGGLLGGALGLAGSFLGGSAGSENQTSSSTTNTTQQSNSLTNQESGPGSLIADAYSNTFLPQLMAAYGAAPQGSYTDQLIASASPIQQAAIQAGTATGVNALGQGQQVRGLAEGLLSGQYLSPQSNPYLQQTIQAAIRPAIDNFQQVQVPAINSDAIGRGAYGGSRNGVALGTAAGNLQSNILDASTAIAANNYQTERDRQLSAGNLLSQAFGLDTSATDYLRSIGAEDRSFTQDALTNNFQLDQLARTQPFQQLETLGNLLNLTGSRSNVSETDTNSTGTSSTEATGSLSAQLSPFAGLQQGANIGGAVGELINGGASIGSFLGGLF